MLPTFPLTVIHEDGETWVLNTPDELAATVEWFDSDDSDGSMWVIDAEGRPVRLKVEALEIHRLEVQEGPAPQPTPQPLRPRRRRAAA